LFHGCKFFERIPLASENDRFHFCQNIINILTNKCAFVYEHRLTMNGEEDDRNHSNTTRAP